MKTVQNAVHMSIILLTKKQNSILQTSCANKIEIKNEFGYLLKKIVD